MYAYDARVLCIMHTHLSWLYLRSSVIQLIKGNRLKSREFVVTSNLAYLFDQNTPTEKQALSIQQGFFSSKHKHHNDCKNYTTLQACRTRFTAVHTSGHVDDFVH